jgi:hypothetical protein
MNPPLWASVRSWLAEIFFCDPVDRAADAIQWGWLPALSGIAVAADHAHARTPQMPRKPADGSNMSGSAHYSPSHGIMT